MARKTQEQDEPVQAVEAEPTYDADTQVITEDGEVKAMPSGEWTAAVTESGNLRRSKGLLVVA